MRWRFLVGLLWFLGVTAFLGGAGLLLGYTPPLDLLTGSPFTNYVLPGIALMVLVGAGSLWAAWAMVRRRPWGRLAALAAGLMILVFEGVELLAIGFTWLLAIYVAVGVAICLLAAGLATRPS